MTRRDVFKRAMMVFGVLVGTPVMAIARTRGFVLPRMTIDLLLRTSFEEAKTAYLRGQYFASVDLKRLVAEKRVILKDLGPQVEERFTDGSRRLYDVEELSVPMVWTENHDYFLSENAMISHVASLIESAIKATDSLIVQRLGSGRAVVSKHYRYMLGETKKRPNNVYTTKLYTAVAFLDGQRK